MVAKKRPANQRELSELAKNILQDVRDDFTAKDLPATALTEHYVGVSIGQLRQKFCKDAEATQVDFDLALKELEGGLLIGTGPMVPFENRPDTHIFIMALFSKREYAYRTEAGYRAAAQIGNQRPRSGLPRIHISGGTFHQSQIGIGEQVSQVQKLDIENDAEVVEQLAQLLLATGASVNDASKAEIVQLVEATHQGDLKQAKPIFQKLFGLASESVKQTAWGILTAIIAKAIGIRFFAPFIVNALAAAEALF
jgi:hypothetical protein